MRMKVADVTPDWIKARMSLRDMSQGEVAREIGLSVDKMSKSMTGKRRFTASEKEKLATLLCEPEPPELDPQVLEFARRIAALPEQQLALLRAMLGTLEAQQSTQGAPGSETPPADSPA